MTIHSIKAQIIKYAVPLLAAALMLSLKLYCDYAPASALKWILGPIASLVEVINGMNFSFREDGYLDTTGTILLGNTCTGINFMTITLLMSVFSFLPGMPYRKQAILAVVLAAAAFLLTVFVNAFRISISIKLVKHDPSLGTGIVHEAQGVLYYLLFLLIYYFTLRYLFTKSRHYAPAA